MSDDGKVVSLLSVQQQAGLAREDTARLADVVELVRLSRLPLLDYERARRPAAEQLGIRPRVLDGLVKKIKDAVFSRPWVLRRGLPHPATLKLHNGEIVRPAVVLDYAIYTDDEYRVEDNRLKGYCKGQGVYLVVVADGNVTVTEADPRGG